MPARDLALLTAGARAAGSIALRYWRNAPDVWNKPGGAGPVTEADMAIDRMLHVDLRAARPDYGWLSEETEDGPDRLHHDAVFIVDPIDGTRAFVAGEPGFCHALAVVRAGQVTAAVVYLPVADLLYTATVDAPALCNGQAIRPSGRTDLDGADVLAGPASLSPQHWAGPVPRYHHGFRASLAHRMCLVAEGSADAMIAFGDTWEWDIAAGDLIARQAGVTVTDRQGLPLRYNAPFPKLAGVLAAPPLLHARIMAQRAA